MVLVLEDHLLRSRDSMKLLLLICEPVLQLSISIENSVIQCFYATVIFFLDLLEALLTLIAEMLKFVSEYFLQLVLLVSSILDAILKLLLEGKVSRCDEIHYLQSSYNYDKLISASFI